MLCVFQLYVLYMYHREVYTGDFEVHQKDNYKHLSKWKEFKPNLEKVIDSFKDDWDQ